MEEAKSFEESVRQWRLEMEKSQLEMLKSQEKLMALIIQRFGIQPTSSEEGSSDSESKLVIEEKDAMKSVENTEPEMKLESVEATKVQWSVEPSSLKITPEHESIFDVSGTLSEEKLGATKPKLTVVQRTTSSERNQVPSLSSQGSVVEKSFPPEPEASDPGGKLKSKNKAKTDSDRKEGIQASICSMQTMNFRPRGRKVKANRMKEKLIAVLSRRLKTKIRRVLRWRKFKARGQKRKVRSRVKGELRRSNHCTKNRMPPLRRRRVSLPCAVVLRITSMALGFRTSKKDGPLNGFGSQVDGISSPIRRIRNPKWHEVHGYVWLNGHKGWGSIREE